MLLFGSSNFINSPSSFAFLFSSKFVKSTNFKRTINIIPAKAGESLWSFKKSKKGIGISKRKSKGIEKIKIPTAKAVDIRTRSKRVAYLFKL